MDYLEKSWAKMFYAEAGTNVLTTPMNGITQRDTKTHNTKERNYTKRHQDSQHQ